MAERKDQMIQVRLSPREKETLQQLVRTNAGTATISEWIRYKIEEEAKTLGFTGPRPDEKLTAYEVELAQEVGLDPWQLARWKQLQEEVTLDAT